MYHFEIARSLDDAQQAVERILTNYSKGDVASTANILKGRIELARGRTANLDSALAFIQRGRNLFPERDTVAASLYYEAEALRVHHRDEEARSLYRQVQTEYGRSEYAARALLGEGRCLVIAGRPLAAIEQWQHVRQRFPGTPEAETALAWSTIAYRLYLRAPARPAFAPSGPGVPPPPGKVKDVNALLIGPGNQLLVAGRNSVIAFDAGGKPAPPPGAAAPRGLTMASDGTVWIILRGAVSPAGGALVPLVVKKTDGTPRPLEDIPAAVLTSFGEILAVDKDAQTVVRFSAKGEPVAPFARVNASRLATTDVDDVAALDCDDKSVSLFDRDGKLAKRVLARGQGYVLDSPSDIAYDALGHLYVLDRGRPQVVVFSHAGAPVVIFALDEKVQGAFRKGTSLAIDAAGRLFVYDDDAERVVVLQ